ncbi:hypothetical protein PHYBOEH_006075 [Phytophthora boehmeriae]|uniref:Uncharacterized protein n=1 Tax=Phytophthora boehmeriae TaxID=109152 RepID=A0A8T1WJU3_9STRA|nr:hypothetical protein PHYBOEH_006075 [Phytophthora boehmeriae]
MNSFVREASTTSAASPAAITATSTPTTTTTVATSAPTAANDNSSSSSPDGAGDTEGPGQPQSPSSEQGSPVRRLPVPLRPPTATPVAPSVVQPTTTGAMARSQSSTQIQTQPPQAGGRDLAALGRRPLYPTESLTRGYSGGSSPPMQPPYFSDRGGRLTTGPSFNQHHLSPVSSPAMAGENWAQNAGTPATTPSGMGTRGLKRHVQQAFGSPSYSQDGYARSAASNLGAIASNVSTRLAQGPQPVQNTAGISVRSPTGTAAAAMGAHRSTSNPTSVGMSTSSSPGRHRQAQMQQMYGAPPSEDPLQYEPSGEARQPRDNTRYETWTSKQLRKKCSHLKLRGLKNVKKHVMVEALYRYYRNQRLKDMADASAAEGSAASQSSNILSQQRRTEPRQPSIGGSSTGGRSDMQFRSRYDQRSSTPSAQAQYNSRPRSYDNYGSQSPSPPSSGGDSVGPRKPPSSSRGYHVDEECKSESQYKEVPVTSEDVIRLVDVVLSPEFVDRLAAELSRWQFWVDVREMYIGLLNRQHPPGSVGAGNGEGGAVSTGGSATNSRNFKWSSMQLWEIWKELSFAYTKTCFEFTAAGMNKRVDDREYINFCDGRPDVYYLHQRLHARPDLLHLIKSNEYIDEKCTSEASETIANEQQQGGGPLVGSGTPIMRNHKRYKRSAPMVGSGGATSAYNNARAMAAYRANDGTAGTGGAVVAGNGPSGDNSGRGSGESRGHSPEENSTENSETTGEDSNTATSSNSSGDVSMRAALAEQKYFGLLLQNFEVIFESLHNKKVLLATLRKDNKAPDHLIADLHDDIHVLSALKKEFRNKLRHTIQ